MATQTTRSDAYVSKEYKIGLDKAYSQDNAVYYDEDKKTLYVAGTRLGDIHHVVGDIVDDILLVPTSQTQQTERYKLIDDYVKKGANKIIAHSLGSAVAQQYINDNKDLKIKGILYDIPAIQLKHDKRITDKSRYGDPISIFDLSAQRSIGIPHKY